MGVRHKCQDVSDQCSICQGFRRFPKQLEVFSPKLNPAHLGTHMNADVIRRASQFILVFSGYTTATFLMSEDRDNMAQGLLALITPIRNSPQVLVRTDKAATLQSLANRPHEELEWNGSKISLGQLSQALTVLNDRIRNQGLSSSQIHFSRDMNLAENLLLDDCQLSETLSELRQANHPHSAKAKAPKAQPEEPLSIQPGYLVIIKKDGDKHQARNTLLVKSVKGETVGVQKILHSQENSVVPPKFT